MTEIEVPSWVVGRAIDSFWRELDPEERQDPEWRKWAEEEVSAMLRAALGAWVVPAHFATDGAGDVPVFEEFTELDQAYAHAGDDGWVVEAYTLRQEKPDVLP